MGAAMPLDKLARWHQLGKQDASEGLPFADDVPEPAMKHYTAGYQSVVEDRADKDGKAAQD